MLNLRRLFRVLVLGGTALTQTECGPSQPPPPTGVGTTPTGGQPGGNNGGDGGTGNPGGGHPGGGGPGGW